jgi:hypothetical protein
MLNGVIVSSAWTDQERESLRALAGTEVVPSAVLLDSRGGVVGRHEGPLDRLSLVALLAPALSGEEP